MDFPVLREYFRALVTALFLTVKVNLVFVEAAFIARVYSKIRAAN
jgi:hypothetical protein